MLSCFLGLQSAHSKECRMVRDGENTTLFDVHACIGNLHRIIFSQIICSTVSRSAVLTAHLIDLYIHFNNNAAVGEQKTTVRDLRKTLSNTRCSCYASTYHIADWSGK